MTEIRVRIEELEDCYCAFLAESFEDGIESGRYVCAPTPHQAWDAIALEAFLAASKPVSETPPNLRRERRTCAYSGDFDGMKELVHKRLPISIRYDHPDKPGLHTYYLVNPFVTIDGNRIGGDDRDDNMQIKTFRMDRIDQLRVYPGSSAPA